MQLRDATPRDLPAKGGQLVEISSDAQHFRDSGTGEGLGFQDASFSVWIGKSIGIKDRAGKRITCVSGPKSGSRLDLRVEYASGVYVESRVARGWFRSAIPSIAFISPSKSKIGDTITLFGTGFGTNAGVVEARVAGIPCASTTLVSDILVECLLAQTLRGFNAVTISVGGQLSVANPACSLDLTGCVKPVEDPVVISLVLDMDFSAVGAEKSSLRESFITTLVHDLAAAAGTSPTLFSITSVTAGSIIVEIVISAGSFSFTSLSPANVAIKLSQAVLLLQSAQGAASATNSPLARAETLVLPAAIDLLAAAESNAQQVCTHVHTCVYT